jgi:putative transposase
MTKISYSGSSQRAISTRFGLSLGVNTDSQRINASQFTSAAFTGVLEKAGIRISMDGRGRWMDNV